jgi:hypothetical protein
MPKSLKVQTPVKYLGQSRLPFYLFLWKPTKHWYIQDTDTSTPVIIWENVLLNVTCVGVARCVGIRHAFKCQYYIGEYYTIGGSHWRNSICHKKGLKFPEITRKHKPNLE